MKKICFVVAVDITLKFLLISELKFFKNQGYDVFVVCSPGKWLQDIKKEGVVVKEIIINRKIFTPISDLISLIRLFFYFKKEKFDLVLTFTPKPGFLGQLAAKMANVPIIINTIFGYYFHENTPFLKRKFFIWIEKLSAKCSSFIFFRNQEDFKTAQKENIVNPNFAEYIGDGIGLEKFNPTRFSPDSILQLKKSLGINTDYFVIGIVARLVKEKGYMELFEAFKNVLTQFPNTLLLVVGPADLQKKDNINPANIKQKNIIFLGERTNVDQLYSVMDMFVLPSYREGFPHSVMESSAMALPVVTTNVRGCRDAVENNITGIIVPPKNSQALQEAIIYFLKHPDIAKLMGQTGRKKAEKQFDRNILLQKMAEKIKELI